MAPVTGNNITDTNTNKFLSWNPIDSNSGALTWDVNGDLGDSSGDLQGLYFYQTAALNAYAMMVGQPDNTFLNGDESGYILGKGTLLGVFALKFTQTGVWGQISAQKTPDGVWWYIAQNDTAIVSHDVPEPASLGMLALGSVALLARRRRR